MTVVSSEHREAKPNTSFGAESQSGASTSTSLEQNSSNEIHLVPIEESFINEWLRADIDSEKALNDEEADAAALKQWTEVVSRPKVETASFFPPSKLKMPKKEKSVQPCGSSKVIHSLSNLFNLF